MTKRSKVERAKVESQRLRGTLAESLQRQSGVFTPDDAQVLKFHGVYQQEDRDQRVARRQSGLEKLHEFMVRIRLPGGRISADQWLAIDAAERGLSSGRGLRLTSRQAIQFHGSGQKEIAPLLRSLDAALLTTLGACGDVGRNVMVSPFPIADRAHELAWSVAREVSSRLELRTGSYREVWIEGVRQPEGTSRMVESEPLYGDSYLPRKFKVGITVAGENAIDVFTHDVGLIVVEAPDGRWGVDVLIGGGLGLTHRRADTFARLASPIGWVPAESAAEVVEQVVALFRDTGERWDRRHARLKYQVEAGGVEQFRSLLEARWGRPLEPWVDPGPWRSTSLLGGLEQRDGRFSFGVLVDNGRLVRSAEVGLREILRATIEDLGASLVLTPDQNLLLVDLEADQLRHIASALGPESSLARVPLRRFAMACPALPTCGLALADAERVAPEVLDTLQRAFDAHGVGREPVAIRITGCPNGCARPYTADIGLVGRSPGHYDVYVGGGLAGNRLGELFEEKVACREISKILSPLIAAWSRDRRPGEPLGSFYWRLRPEGPSQTLRRGDKNPARALLALADATTTPEPPDITGCPDGPEPRNRSEPSDERKPRHVQLTD